METGSISSKFYEKNGFWLIEGDEAISSWVLTHNRLDWAYQELDLIRKRLGDRKLRTCIDVGAYIGDYTKTFAQWFDRVVAFEPQEAAYECLLRNVPEENVFCFNGAVGNINKTYVMQVCHNNHGASQVKLGKGRSFLSPDGVRAVDFIKIDVEGHEPQVLYSCERIIERDHPHMLIEQRVHDGNEEEVKDFLRKHGYKFDVVSGDETVMYDLYCE